LAIAVKKHKFSKICTRGVWWGRGRELEEPVYHLQHRMNDGIITYLQMTVIGPLPERCCHFSIRCIKEIIAEISVGTDVSVHERCWNNLTTSDLSSALKKLYFHEIKNFTGVFHHTLVNLTFFSAYLG
jgi:hypothetical protein